METQTLEMQTLAHIDLKAGDGRIDCQCPDQGSIRCVLVHTTESRENWVEFLVKILSWSWVLRIWEKWWQINGPMRKSSYSMKLYANLVSLGRNFWVALSAVFPSQTNMEIVSYYFNVFMRRKRAEQNRFDPMNIDSDDDEWQGNDNDLGKNSGGSDEDDNSCIESPVCYDGLTFHKNGLNVHEHEEDDSDVSDDAEETYGTSGPGQISKSDADSAFQLTGKTSEGVESDAQDGSCHPLILGPLYKVTTDRKCWLS